MKKKWLTHFKRRENAKINFILKRREKNVVQLSEETFLALLFIVCQV